MALTFTTGDLFEAPEDHALVIPVNTRGVAGAGLALEATRCKGWERGYKLWLKTNRRHGGSVGTFVAGGRVWVLAATKEEWTRPSRVEWVTQVLWRLAQLGTHPLALPKLGCGKGGLDWEGTVKPQVVARCAQPGPELNWLVYE